MVRIIKQINTLVRSYSVVHDTEHVSPLFLVSLDRETGRALEDCYGAKMMESGPSYFTPVMMSGPSYCMPVM